VTTTWNTEPPENPPLADSPHRPLPPPLPDPLGRPVGQPSGMSVTTTLGPPTQPPPPPAEPSSPLPVRRGGGWRVAFLVALLAALFGMGYAVRDVLDEPDPTFTVGSNTPVSLQAGTTPTIESDGDEPVAAVAQAVSPAVVQIETGQGLGSGTIYDADGLIMTNAHVVGSASSVRVRLADGATYEGEVLGADRSSDIAVVRIDADDLPVARLAADPVAVGQTAVALGSPFGLSQTVTAGIVSAVDRAVPNELGIAVNMIQTDAPINPGNSGGALANRRGEIIGVPTAIFSQSGENNGIGFAVPIETAKRIADQIASGLPVEKAALGIGGTSGAQTDEPGALVGQVNAGGPADEAGVEVGDLIVAVDDKTVEDFSALQGHIGTYQPGEVVVLDVVRNGARLNLTVTLGSS
jgi:putative serine protease PepD